MSPNRFVWQLRLAGTSSGILEDRLVKLDTTVASISYSSLVPRPFLSVKKKAKKSGGRVWANGLLLGVAPVA